MSRLDIPQVKSMKSVQAVRERCGDLGVDIAMVDQPGAGADSPLGRPLRLPDAAWPDGRTVGNRFCVLPMEGWDGTTDGLPTDLVRRRWERFGESGAKLVWGGEAVAVRPDGRANPRQLTIDSDRNAEALGDLRERLVAAHLAATGATDDLVVGLQLTHSGRYSRPDAGGIQPWIAQRHPLLDQRLPPGGPTGVFSDDQLDELAAQFVEAAGRAAAAGFDFVDVKACHGYLGHELLGSVDRPGRYGGDLAGRTRFLRTVVEGVRAASPGLAVGCRFSVFDFVPFHAGADGVGEPDALPEGNYRHAFGGDGSGLGIDLGESLAVIDLLAELGSHLVCVTAGSPYYVPHIQRPAWFPPSDGYQPPEDPLVGVARLLGAAAELKRSRPATVVVGSGYSYLQEWLAHAGEAAVRDGSVDSVGLGRMVLSYPDLPLDVLAGRTLDRRRLCRTFSDCTTAPRAGLVSGCYPLDPAYKAMPERVELARVKKSIRSGGTT